MPCDYDNFARALISSEGHPHLNLSTLPSCDPREGGRETPGEGVLYFSSFILA